MSVTSHIDALAGLVTLTFTGETSFEEWCATVEAVLAHPDFRTNMCFMSDRRAATDIMSKPYFERIVDFLVQHAPKLGGCGWAIVAWTPADFGMSRMAAIFAERSPVEVRAFRQYDDALAWLRQRAPGCRPDAP